MQRGREIQLILVRAGARVRSSLVSQPHSVCNSATCLCSRAVLLVSRCDPDSRG